MIFLYPSGLKTFKLFIFALFEVLLFIVSTGINAVSQPEINTGKYEFVYGNSIVIPFELHDNLIVVKIRINNSDTLNFILDSGASINLVTDSAASASLGLVYQSKIDINGYGTGHALPAWVSSNNQIYLSGLIGTGQTLLALREDLMDISSYVGIPIHGILGYDLFNHFVVKIDYRNNRIILHDSNHFKLRKRNGTVFKISVQKGKSHLPAIVEIGEQELPVDLLIDTGAGSGLMLKDHFPIPSKSNYKMLGSGLNGDFYGFEGRVEALKIGKYNLKNIIAAFPDSTNLKNHKSNNSGNLGCEVLKRFSVTFNYSENYIVLKPDKEAFKIPFERDMSGLAIRAKGPEFNSFIVESVDKGTPAWEAGIQKGDEIYMINKRNAFKLTFNEIHEILNRREGKVVNLIIKREKEILDFRFKLRRSI